MEKTVKILLIVCVILVAALSLTVGVLVGHPNNAPLVVNTTNNTTAAANNTVNQTQTVKNSTNKKSSKISAAQAGNIALKYAEKTYPGEGWSVNDIRLNTYGIYVVEVFNQAEVEAARTNTPNPADKSMDVYINAKTGAITSSPLG